ncbi:restriction endonuclease subunit S [Gardnerella vaginalis]|uniref:restriction endonuclease subunit S n=1 Tax=Gardnerella vaginalis TaxID=2702 RepID=UPI0021527DE7|nr:restriction endonuclease subunit S [Gardnerella vaginalis]
MQMSKKLDPKFMAFYLRGSYFRRTINSLATMTTRASFNETLFSFLSLELPDINTQVAIGNLLFNLEKKIQANKKLNDNLAA